MNMVAQPEDNSELPIISVVIPVYGSPESLGELCERLINSIRSLTEKFEIILVDDLSPDDSWQIIEDFAVQDVRVVGIQLSKNFGQHSAITAGLRSSRGEWIVVMDCDLQDRPEEIPKLYTKALEGFDSVVAVRSNRQDSFLKSITSAIYIKLLSYLSGQKINPQVSNFGIYNRKVIDAICELTEQTRTFSLLASWVGFARAEISVTHMPRPYGESSYTTGKLLKLGLNGLVSYSDKLLYIVIKVGLLVSLASGLGISWIIAEKLLGHTSVDGWSSVVAALLLLSGLLMVTIGTVGVYVGQIFDEVKSRPSYIVSKSTSERK